jgi:hypothetical protein
MWLDSGTPGMVLVVARGRDTRVQGYGETIKGNGSVPASSPGSRSEHLSQVPWSALEDLPTSRSDFDTLTALNKPYINSVQMAMRSGGGPP